MPLNGIVSGMALFSREFIAVPDDRKGQIVFKWPDVTIRRFTHAIVNADEVALFVNTGQVVPPGQVDRLFLPFTRLDDRTRHDGFGLGLALVSSITTVHKGAVDATAIPTGGLDITVRLPRRDERAG